MISPSFTIVKIGCAILNFAMKNLFTLILAFRVYDVGIRECSLCLDSQMGVRGSKRLGHPAVDNQKRRHLFIWRTVTLRNE